MSPGAESWIELLARYFDPRVLCEVQPPRGATVPVRGRVGMAEAREARRREFVAGRACAQQLIARLGLPATPIPVAKDRSPVWPTGVVGSITHSRLLYAVAVARDSELRSLGLDTEPDAALEPELWPTICTPDELETLGRLPRAARARMVRLVFSAKECVYKCLHPVLHAGLDFQDVQVSFGPEPHRFAALVSDAAGGALAGQTLAGFHATHAGSILTGMTLPHGSERPAHPSAPATGPT